MTPDNDFAELQELKAQCALMKEKLQQQEIVNEHILHKAMSERIASIKKWYRKQFLANAVAVPILGIVFAITQQLQWEFIALMFFGALLQLALDWKGYRMLNPDQLFSLPITEAAERVARHKWWRIRSCQIIALPFIVLMVWVVLIACHYTWHLPILALTSTIIIVGITWGIADERRLWKQLDETLRDIRILKE